MIMSPKKTTVYTHFDSIIKARDYLTGQERTRFDRQISQTANNLLKAAASHEQLASLPLQMPDSVPKRIWKRKVPTIDNSRALTAVELQGKAEQQAIKKVRIETRDKVILLERQVTEIQAASTPVPQQNLPDIDYNLLLEEEPIPDTSIPANIVIPRKSLTCSSSLYGTGSNTSNYHSVSPTEEREEENREEAAGN